MFAATRGANAPLDPNSAYYLGGATGTDTSFFGTVSFSGLGLQQGDFIVAVVARDVASVGSISTSGYTTVASLTNTGVSLLVAYKFMGASPDASFVFDGNGDGVGLAHAWRNINPVTPLAATTTTAVGSASKVNSPAISFSGGGIILSVGALDDGSINAAPSGMTNYVSRAIFSPDLNAAIASTYSTAGTYDPAAFDASNASWCAATLALNIS